MIILRYDPNNYSMIKQCKDTLFVFEDTLDKGHYLSKFSNCYGIPVKFNRHNGYSSHFRDNPIEFEIIKSSLDYLEIKLVNFRKLAFPTIRFGTDIANWSISCPEVNRYFESEVSRRFNLVNN